MTIANDWDVKQQTKQNKGTVLYILEMKHGVENTSMTNRARTFGCKRNSLSSGL